MAISSLSQYQEKVSYAIGDASNILSTEEILSALNRALNELSWSLPVTNQNKEFWLIERGQRHCLDILRSSSAHKFKYKQINLSHRFEHYNTMVDTMDRKFITALDNDPALATTNGANLFMYINSGFDYGELGEDLTYLDQLGS